MLHFNFNGSKKSFWAKQTRLLGLCILLFFSTAQIGKTQHINDNVFATEIKAQCPTCIDAGNNLTSAAKTQRELKFYGKSINSLAGIEGFTALENLEIGFVGPSSLPPLPASLKTLTAIYLPITTISGLPNSLIKANFFESGLVTIVDLPPHLEILDCSFTHLSSLPAALPNSLKTFYCHATNLTSLPTLSTSLEGLYCHYNDNLTAIPELPATLKQLNCSFTKVKCLPLLPDGLISLSVFGSSVTCLPNKPVGISSSLPFCTTNILETIQKTTCDKNAAGIFTVNNSIDPITCNVNQTKTVITYIGDATAPTITQNDNLLTSSSGANYQWYLNGVAIVGATNQTYSPTTFGDYSVSVQNANGCIQFASNTVLSEIDFEENCPQIHKNFGAVCDDGDPKTSNDRVRNDCKCRGDYVSKEITTQCPKDITVVSTSQYGTVVNWADNIFASSESANDCAGIVDIIQTSGYYNGYPFEPNATVVIEYVATDKCGNKSSCSFIVRTTALESGNFATIAKSNPKILQVSPNPANSLLKVAINQNSETETELHIVNMFGQKLITDKRKLSKGFNEIVLNISELQNGFYFVTTSQTGQTPMKFVKE